MSSLLGVPSKFSVLKGPIKANAKKKTQTDKPKKELNGTSSEIKSKPTAHQAPSAKAKQNNNSVNVIVKTEKSNEKKKKKAKLASCNSVDQWEKWKEVDSKQEKKQFETDLNEALLQSLLDYEEKKEFYADMKRLTEMEKKKQTKTKVKNKISQPIIKSGICSDKKEVSKNGSGDGKNMNLSNFEVQNTVCSKEDVKINENIKQDSRKRNEKEPELLPIDDEELSLNRKILQAKNEEKLELKNKEIEELKMKNSTLEEKLNNVKLRNKKLCQVLALGEMKDKAEVLVQVYKLEQMRDELLETIADLHAQLEQERSNKSHASLNDTKSSKDKPFQSKK